MKYRISLANTRINANTDSSFRSHEVLALVAGSGLPCACTSMFADDMQKCYLNDEQTMCANHFWSRSNPV